MNWVPVRVEFLSRSQGGRTTPPSGARYACTTVIARGTASEEWSVVLDLTASPPRLRFLVDSAPHNLLVPGLRLDLREGPRIIGTAVVRPSVEDIETALVHLHFVRALLLVRAYEGDPIAGREFVTKLTELRNRAQHGFDPSIHRVATNAQALPAPPTRRPPAFQRQLIDESMGP
jgi:hypothetical protein